MNRAALIDAFLAREGWSDAIRSPLAGDASQRSYQRLRHPSGKTAVLMNAPPERGEDVRPFVRIAAVLRDLGLSAPEVLGSDPVAGLLLIEDLGDALFARLISREPEKATGLMERAVDVLARIHAVAPPTELDTYGVAAMVERAALAYDWYLRGSGAVLDEARVAQFRKSFGALLERCVTGNPVLVLRDYHSENLLLLPDRDGPAAVGLLDFQDATLGPRSYDVVSLATDARRDVSENERRAIYEAYISRTGIDRDGFEGEAAVISVQRNLRILGVFARLGLRDGKPGYISLMPRVWGYLKSDLAHPTLAGIRDRILDDLPEPTPEIRRKLEAACKTASP